MDQRLSPAIVLLFSVSPWFSFCNSFRFALIRGQLFLDLALHPRSSAAMLFCVTSFAPLASFAVKVPGFVFPITAITCDHGDSFTLLVGRIVLKTAAEPHALSTSTIP